MGNADLLRRLEECAGSDNAIDMDIEIALFRPDGKYASVRKNTAGTKLIYMRTDGRSETFLAWDWSMHKDSARAALEASDA